MALSSGLGEFSLGNFALIKLFAAFIILTVANTFNISTAFVHGGNYGLWSNAKFKQQHLSCRFYNLGNGGFML